jgi:hypothetical protein
MSPVNQARLTIQGMLACRQNWVAILVLSALFGSVFLGSTARADGSCESRILVDYRKPLRGLPSVHGAPSAPLRFGGGGAELYPVWSDLLLNDGFAGYALSINGELSDFRPGWIVNAQLSRMANMETGPVVSSLTRRLDRVRSLDQLDFSLQASFGVGIYKYRVEFESARHKRLGVFERYVRVLPKRFRASLFGNRKTVAAGEDFEIQVHNLGTVRLGYGEGVIVERLVGPSWENAGFPHQQSRKRAVSLEPGHAGGCIPIQVPTDAVAGMYRARIRVSTGRSQARYLEFRFEIPSA